MLEPLELLDVADRDFLSSEEEPDDDDDDEEDDDSDDDDESDSESDIDKFFAIAAAKNRLFGRKRPLHVVLGAGKAADIMLWRDKNVSASILASLTIIWFLFEGLGYNLLNLICHSLILLLAVLFLWINLGPLVPKLWRPLELSDISLPERLLANAAVSLRCDVVKGLKAFGVIAFDQDFKIFLMVTVTLWGLSVIGAWFSFITLFYIVSVILLIFPMLYEKQEDIIDIIAEKVSIELNNQYAEVKKYLGGTAYSYEKPDF